MNILINCSNLKIGGGLQVAHSFIYELRKYPQHTYCVVLSSQMEEILRYEEFGQNFVFVEYDVKIFWNEKNKFLDSLVLKYKIERIFSVFGPSYWKPQVPHICGYAKSHYVYKESPFFKQLSILSRVKLRIKEFIHIRSFKQSDILITENDDITRHLQNIMPEKKIFTVSNYYNQVFNNEQLWDKTINLPSFDGITLLTISANYPHKNLQIIPQVINYIQQHYPELKFRFVLTIAKQDLSCSITDDIKEHIVFLGKVAINQCPYLYQQSDFMFLPTLLECFSASYAEAMYMQKPILTSDLGFAKGLCGNAAVYFNPLDAKDIADKIVILAKSKELQSKLVNDGLSQLKKFDDYTTRAKKYLEIITQ
jgi:glycosyltransferase involved in cell wall biosynthesis